MGSAMSPDLPALLARVYREAFARDPDAAEGALAAKFREMAECQSQLMASLQAISEQQLGITHEQEPFDHDGTLRP